MKANLKNTYHDKLVELTIRPLTNAEYDTGKSGYTITRHSANRVCNLHIRLSKYQTKRFFDKTCGSTTCKCHKFELMDYPQDQQITHDKHGNINIMILDIPFRCINSKK